MFASLTGAGLSAAAGLNAYIPLLLVGLISRFSDAMSLPGGWDWLASWPALAGMTVLLVVEFVVDKVPVVDHINDVIQTVVRPAAGGAALSASTAASGIDESVGTAVPSGDDSFLGWIAGILIALSVHIAKAVLRGMINAGTIGFGAPVASAAEDGGSVGMSLLAIFLPILAGIVLLAMLAGFIWLWRVRRRRKRRRAEQAPAGAD